MQNDGTNKLLLKLLLFKGKIIESQLPDEEELLKGVSIIEQYIRIINPIDLSESEIDKVVEHVNDATSPLLYFKLIIEVSSTFVLVITAEAFIATGKSLVM